MNLLRGFGRLLAYPILRPMSQAKESLGRLQGDLGTLRSARERRAQALEEQIRQASEDGFEFSAEQLRDPRLIANPRTRFVAVARFRGWTEAELDEQVIVHRRAKLVCLVATAVAVCASLTSLLMAPVWMLLLLGPVTMTCAAAGFAFAVKSALYQSQLESRSLHGVKDYLSRPDLLRHLLS